MKTINLALGATLVLAGCATSPKDIQPTYVSPVLYQNLSCQQLAQEAARVSHEAQTATGAQTQQQSRDAVATTVGVIVFWPALFLIGGDKGNAAQIANLKGQMNAIEQASIAKNCGIQFQKG